MVKLREEYKEIINQRRKVIDEIKELENDERIRRYCELKDINERLYEKQFDLRKRIKLDEYSSCNHILVYSKIDYDGWEGRTYRSCGCIKCGLDSGVLDGDRKYFSVLDQLMYDYLKGNHVKGKLLEVVCDLDLAHAIYSKIKK